MCWYFMHVLWNLEIVKYDLNYDQYLLDDKKSFTLTSRWIIYDVSVINVCNFFRLNECRCITSIVRFVNEDVTSQSDVESYQDVPYCQLDQVFSSGI